MNLVQHRFRDVAGLRTFCREAGPPDAPVLLLPHGYPCSSFEFRNLIPLLADRWRLIAPDFPGNGYSDTPEEFAHTFDGYAAFLERLLDQLGVERFAIYLHDFGSQIGLRLAMRRPERISALVIQNGDIYEDELGPKYAGLQEYWCNPTAEARAKLAAAITEDGFKDEFLNDVRPDLAARIPPDLWKLHWGLTTPRRRQIYHDVIAGLLENRDWFPRYQRYLREHQPPNADRLGSAGRLHARARGARLSTRPSGGGASLAGWRALAARDEPRRGGDADPGVPRAQRRHAASRREASARRGGRRRRAAGSTLTT